MDSINLSISVLFSDNGRELFFQHKIEDIAKPDEA